MWPSVFIFCLVGSYGLSQSMVDVYIMLISGAAGFFLRRSGFSPAPIIMGIVLGGLVENSLAQSIIIFDQNLFMFFTRPIALTFFALTLLSLFYKPIKNLLMKGRWNEKAYTPNINSSKGKDLTKYVSKFIYQTKFKDIPSNVVELAKKHILDGFGLALSGSVARTGDYLFKQIKRIQL